MMLGSIDWDTMYSITTRPLCKLPPHFDPALAFLGTDSEIIRWTSYSPNHSDPLLPVLQHHDAELAHCHVRKHVRSCPLRGRKGVADGMGLPDHENPEVSRKKPNEENL